MKKITLFLFLCGVITFSANAQNQTPVRSSRSSVSVSASDISPESLTKRSEAVHHCKDLNEQLIKLFGADYSIADSKVRTQLERNIYDKKASNCIRKNSLYAVYGEEYVKYVHLIQNK